MLVCYLKKKKKDKEKIVNIETVDPVEQSSKTDPTTLEDSQNKLDDLVQIPSEIGTVTNDVTSKNENFMLQPEHVDKICEQTEDEKENCLESTEEVKPKNMIGMIPVLLYL